MSILVRFLAILLIVTPLAFAQNQSSPGSEQVDEVLVIGEQPGPRLWKLFYKDHVMWILGTLAPLPQKMEWRSHEAESALTQSQALLLPPDIEIDASAWSMISMLPSLIGAEKNPEGVTLQELVPEDVYQHWILLKQKYIGKDNAIEKYRPMFAGAELVGKSIKKNGLTGEDIAREKVQKIAKKNKLVVIAPKLPIKLKDPKSTVKKFKRSSIDDVACFSKTLDRLETDLGSMRTRANAWATGDLEMLASLPFVDNDTPCFEAMKNSAIAEDVDIKSIPILMENLWMQKVDEALGAYASTFAILPVSELLKPDGILKKLQARGYRVEGYGFDAGAEALTDARD